MFLYFMLFKAPVEKSIQAEINHIHMYTHTDSIHSILIYINLRLFEIGKRWKNIFLSFQKYNALASLFILCIKAYNYIFPFVQPLLFLLEKPKMK